MRSIRRFSGFSLTPSIAPGGRPTELLPHCLVAETTTAKPNAGQSTWSGEIQHVSAEPAAVAARRVERNRPSAKCVNDHVRCPATVAAIALTAVLAGCGTAQGEEIWQATPPDGTRWVGWGQVVVAVPEWWTTGETRCLTPVEDTVYFDPSAIAECTDRPPAGVVREVSALAMLDGTSGYGEFQIRGMRSTGDVAGREVLELDGCDDWFPEVCRRMFAVPSEGVVFAVTIAEPGDGSYEEIRSSLRVLPDNKTTVPLRTTDGWTPAWGAEPRAVDALAKALERAGLRVEIETVTRTGEDSAGLVADLPPGSLLEVSPELGSVIDVGGTVTITVAGDSTTSG